MLGTMAARVLAQGSGIEVVVTTRTGGGGALAFEAGRDSVPTLLEVSGCDWIVNSIGVLDHKIDDEVPESVAAAMEANARLPVRLAEAAGPNRRIIHITTDGVFSGASGPYDELSPHDAESVYARSKSLGEVVAPHVVNLRCSIIGPEPPPPVSLLGWALSQPQGASITGYVNHLWNGVSSLHLARLCRALIETDQHTLPSTLHVVPGDWATKADLLGVVLGAFGRTDVEVVRGSVPQPVDRRLTTGYPEASRSLWRAAGYPEPPRIADMVNELAEFCRPAGTPTAGESG